MLNRISIITRKDSKGLKNIRIKGAFKNAFGVEPDEIRVEKRNIIVHTSLELKENKVRKFADNLGSYSQFMGSDDSYSFKL